MAPGLTQPRPVIVSNIQNNELKTLNNNKDRKNLRPTITAKEWAKLTYMLLVWYEIKDDFLRQMDGQMGAQANR